MAKDRRKIAWIGVVSGVAALAVAATGVAFAILSGNGSTSDPGNVEVDVLKGPYGTIEAELKDDSIALLGTGTKGQFISVEGKEDLQVSFAKLQANLSKAFVDENIDRTIDLKVDLITELPSLSADADLIGIRDASKAPFSYLEFNKTVDSLKVSDLVWSEADGYFIFDIKDKVCTFSWGSFFEGKNPQTYYEEKMGGDKPALAPTHDNFRKVVDELNDMDSAFKDLSIKLQVSLDIE